MPVDEKPKADRSNPTEIKKTCALFWKKWDRRIASVFGLLAFFTLVGIVIYNNAKSGYNDSKKLDLRMLSEELRNKCVLKRTAIKEDCFNITCTNVNETAGESFAYYINKLINNQNHTEISFIELTLVNCSFVHGILKKRWLEDVSGSIEELIIIGGYLEEIEEGALGSKPFVLSKLHLRDINITTIKKAIFSGLRHLVHFEFKYYSQPRLLRVEERALEEVPNLERIFFSKVAFDDDGLTNSFGCKAALLSKLEILDVSDGILEKLTNCSLTNIPSVKSIFFRRSHLKSIEEGAFSKNLKVNKMDLSGNLLTTLNNETFGVFRNKSVMLSLGNNPWKCNCSLQWLKDDYLSRSYIDPMFPPQCDNNKKFDDYDFCLSVSRMDKSLTQTVVSSSAPSTSHLLLKSLTVNSTVYNQSAENKNKNAVAVYSTIVVIDNRCVNLEFRELNTNPFTVEVSSDSSLAKYDLVWFNSNRKEETGRADVINNPLVLSDLQRNTIYTFSVLFKDALVVSPKCTYLLQTTSVWGDRLWISNKYRLTIISVLCATIVALILLTILATFLCIRSFPKLISGNKCVIVVNSKKNSQDIELSKNYEKPVYWDPYLKPISQGYLTPKDHRYYKVKSRPSLMRSISEWSYTNNSSSYDDPEQMYGLKVLRSRLQEQNFLTRNHFEEIKPPLPPPNGFNRVEIMDTFDEESIYNSL